MPQTENKDILFIINSKSGNGKVDHIIKSINKVDSNLSYLITTNTDEVKAAFINTIKKYKVFVVVGSDGSVHEMVKYLYGRFDK